MKQVKAYAGEWSITEMEVWDQDYVDMEVPGYIRIDSDGTGEFQFGLLSGDIPPLWWIYYCMFDLEMELIV